MRYRELKQQLESVERNIAIAVKFKELLASPVWNAIAGILQSELTSACNKMIDSARLTEREMGILAGGAAVCRMLLRLPNSKADDLERLEKAAQGLRQRVSDMENKGLDVAPAELRRDLSLLRNRIQEYQS